MNVLAHYKHYNMWGGNRALALKNIEEMVALCNLVFSAELNIYINILAGEVQLKTVADTTGWNTDGIYIYIYMLILHQGMVKWE